MKLALLEGRTFGPHQMRVCKEKVDEFLRATAGDEDRWPGFAPPGYLASALFVVAPELLANLDSYSVIHGEQTFRWLRPLAVEQDLSVSGTVSRIRERGGSYFVSFEMTVADREPSASGRPGPPSIPSTGVCWSGSSTSRQTLSPTVATSSMSMRPLPPARQ